MQRDCLVAGEAIPRRAGVQQCQREVVHSALACVARAGAVLEARDGEADVATGDRQHAAITSAVRSSGAISRVDIQRVGSSQLSALLEFEGAGKEAEHLTGIRGHDATRCLGRSDQPAKPMARCEPSQYGLLREAPHRQR